MIIIDARSGQRIVPGQVITYPELHGAPTWIQLIRVVPGIFKATATIRRGHNDGRDVDEIAVPLVVRWSHPSYFLRHVAFLPT